MRYGRRLPVSPTLYLSRRQTDRDEAGTQRRLRKIRTECGTPTLCTVYTNMVCDTLTPVQPGAPTMPVSPCVLQHLHEYSRCFAFLSGVPHRSPCAWRILSILCIVSPLPASPHTHDETHDELHYECLSRFSSGGYRHIYPLAKQPGHWKKPPTSELRIMGVST